MSESANCTSLSRLETVRAAPYPREPGLRPQRGWSAPGRAPVRSVSAQQHCRPMSHLKTNRRPKNSPKKRRRLRSRNLSRSRSSLKYSDCPRTPAPRRVPSSRIRAQRPRPYSSEQQSRNRRVATRSVLPAAEDPQGRTVRPHQLSKPYRPMWRSLPPGHSRLRLRKDRRRCRKGHARP